MSGTLRITVVFLALAAIALGVYDVANPYRVGMSGYDYRSLANGNHVVTRVYAGSPSERAGIRLGDEVLRNTRRFRNQFEAWYRRAGQPIEIPVNRNGKILHLHIITAPYKEIKPVEEGPIELIVLVIFALTGMLVALRGIARRNVSLLALFFALYSLEMAVWWFGDVAVTPDLAFAGSLALTLVGALSNYALLLFIAGFPPLVSGLRTTVKRLALPLIILAMFLNGWGTLANIVPADQLFQIFGSHAPDWLASVVWSIIDLSLLAMVFEGLARVDAGHRAQMRWVGVAVIMSSSSWLIYNGVFLAGPNQPGWFVWMTLFVDVPLLAIAYAVLRHRLVDLSIVISRAATFGLVSLAIVTMFLVFEWAATQILERTVGEAAATGIPGQALRLALALLVGLSVRPLHAFVEHYLNNVFFAKRSQALAAIGRFALEADVVMNAASLLRLTYDSLRENLESRYVAIYFRRGGEYDRIRTSEPDLPASVDPDDAAIVRLRRWNEPFEMTLGAHAFSEALLVPIAVQGSVLGIFVCGPKLERTHYLRDEVEALAQLAHRVGTAYVLLQHQVLPAIAVPAVAPA